MIQIKNPNLVRICHEYTEYILSQKRRNKDNKYLKYLLNPITLKKFVSCPADKLALIISQFNLQFPDINKESTEWKEFQSYMINQYLTVRAKYLPVILNQLDLTICPYCNRNYIFTINTRKNINAQFDHFYSKTKYPFLALSFYNLIPCCPICNKSKGDSNIGINPYVSGFDDKCFIQIDSPINCILQSDDWNVVFVGNENTMTNVEAFALNELYQKHKDYAFEIVFKEIANEKGYFDSIQKEFQSLGLTDASIQNMLWNSDNINNGNPKRPLSKMTIDIRNQIKQLIED